MQIRWGEFALAIEQSKYLICSAHGRFIVLSGTTQMNRPSILFSNLKEEKNHGCYGKY